MSNIAAAIITIGDELLIGQTIDTNSAWIAQQLNGLGIDVLRRVAVGDDKAAIICALDEELATAELVLVTGGLGPTADDITKPLLNQYFGGKMVVNEAVLEHLKQLFIRRNRPFLERNLKQAEVPDVCTVLFNKMGTAPGMWFEKDGKVIIAMPGVPFEMMSIMQDEALPRIAQRFISEPMVHNTIITAGEGESFIAEKIKDIEESLPEHIKLAYLPGAGMVKLRLTGRGGNADALRAAVRQYMSQIADRLGKIVVAREDIPMEVILGRWLRANNQTLGLAESCTGGNIASHITQVVGSSDYFKGGIVSYADEVKEHVLGVPAGVLAAHGAVSEEVVLAMATGGRKVLGADVVFAITGLLGPKTDRDQVDVGIIWMAVANKDRAVARKVWYPYDRQRNKDMATSMGMLMIWKFLNNEI